MLIRADQGGASTSAMLIRAAAMIHAGIVDRVLVVGADTPPNLPAIAPGLPLSPERTRGVYWDFQGPQAMQMAGVTHRDIQFLQPCDDCPFVAMMTIEDHGFCKKGEGGQFVEAHDLHFDGDFPMSTDGGQLSGGQPGGAIGGFMPLI